LIVLLASIKVVEVNQQLLFSNSEGKWVRNGPFTAVVWPHQRMERREAIRLGSREYVVLKNERTGEKRHVSGPGLVFPEAYDSNEGTRPKIMLQKNEYMRLVDKLSGFERVVKGPQTLVPEPLEESEKGKEQAIIVGATNAVVVLNKNTGMKSLVTQEGMFTPGPYEAILTVQEARLLEPHEYAVVKDDLSGSSRNECGPQLLQIGAYEELLAVNSKVMLQKDEYLRLVDKRTATPRDGRDHSDGPTSLRAQT